MSGATDAPFRKQVVKFGGFRVVSEMTASEQLLLARPDVVRRTCRHHGDSPWIVQLAGRDPGHMEGGARRLAETGVDQIDINMGCPSRKVTGGLSGSALMREPQLAAEIIAATLAGAGDVPVTLKMRLGWDHASLNAPELGAMAERLGVQQLTVHGRTRCQFYKGTADWARISDTVFAVDIPVIANGDIATIDDARRALADSNAAGIMVGRAAVGRPWLPAQIQAQLAGLVFPDPDCETRFESLEEQILDAADLYGPQLGVRITRKHIAAAIADAPIDICPQTRRTLQSSACQIAEPDALIDALRGIFLVSTPRRAA
ncbi:MAG: tRNA-dihydrouridine synthase [Pseudomonadota bacterium]